MSITAITLTGVVRRFALPDLTVRAGELLAVTGPTASGKTTVLNVLAGWDPPDSGTVTWTGATATPPTWAELTVVPQRFALIDELDVTENIALPARGGAPIDDGELATLVDRLGLGPLRSRNVEEISVGERQRVMVARALAGRASVVLADEPVAHQDGRNAGTILRLLRERADRGAACVIATREAEVAAGADRHVELPG